MAGISSTAARLRTTILDYLIVDDAVLIWVVSPGLAPAHVRVPVGSKKLGNLVGATTAALRASSRPASTRGAETADPATDDDLTALPMRGLGVMALSNDDKSVWRELYKTLNRAGASAFARARQPARHRAARTAFPALVCGPAERFRPLPD
jgi:hypothetical protein